MNADEVVGARPPVVTIAAGDVRLPDVLAHLEAGRIVLILPTPQQFPLAA